MKLFRILIFSILIYSCSFEKNGDNYVTNAYSLETLNNDTSNTFIKIDSTIVNTIKKINFKDEHGLRQGKWVKKLKGKIIEIANYKNDTLNGYYQSFELGGGYEGNYINGKREGIHQSWYVYKKSLLAVVFCKNDSAIWMGFPTADENYLFPVKGFHIERDSVFIKAPYENGKTWYEGHFCLRPSKINKGRLMTYAYGTHKIYFRNGRIRGIIDYSKELIKEFDITGKELYEANFNDYAKHKQPIGRY